MLQLFFLEILFYSPIILKIIPYLPVIPKITEICVIYINIMVYISDSYVY